MQKKTSLKLFVIVIAFCALLFFTNSFGIIDIEKTAIITAIGLDMEGEEYEITVQVAVPQASTATQENSKAVISASGATASEAMHQIGDITGWYPNLGFCNLIILGETMFEDNIAKGLDYFSKTFKLQDSACLAACEGKAKDLLKTATPLDNISSFAIQKILLKNPGMTSDVATVDIKDFSVGYYSNQSSAFMPLIRSIEVPGTEDTQKAGGGESGGSGKGNKVFDASYTLLFKNGMKAETLDDHETKTFNLLREKVKQSTFIVDDVEIDGEKENFLLNIISNRCKLSLRFDGAQPVLKIDARIITRVEDRTTADKRAGLESAVFVPDEAAAKAESDFAGYMESILEKCRRSGCDLFELDNRLFRYHHKMYEAYTGKLYDTLKLELNVDFTGVK